MPCSDRLMNCRYCSLGIQSGQTAHGPKLDNHPSQAHGGFEPTPVMYGRNFCGLLGTKFTRAHAERELALLPIDVTSHHMIWPSTPMAMEHEINLMTDFTIRFSELRNILDNDNAEFFGARARSHRQGCRSLAKGKRDELVSLDYADRALAAHKETDVLPSDRLYFMFRTCGASGPPGGWTAHPPTRKCPEASCRGCAPSAA